jgi:Lanthionine synthetase C-like protein
MFLQIYQNETTRSLLPQSLRSAKTFIDHAKKHLQTKDHDKVAFLCGNAGIHSVSCVINKELNNIVISQEDRAHFLAGLPVCQHINFCPYGNDELLFGRAGYLMGIYWMNKFIHPQQQIPDDVIVKICDVIIESGIQYSKRRDLIMPMMWECYGGN